MFKNRKTGKLSGLSLILYLLAILSVAVSVAWFSGLVKIRTSDDETGYITKTGMRINLLFNRLNPSEFSNGSTIEYPDGTTATFDNSASWGSKENPYIINESRHVVNLYALQSSGYFNERYIEKNYSNGEYIANSDIKPYFLVCDTDAKPISVNGQIKGKNIEIEPIGNDEYPFIGCIGGAQVEGTATAPNGKTAKDSILANFTVNPKKDTPDVGLFGKIGYLGDESTAVSVNGVDTFSGAVSGISNLVLYDIKIISKPGNTASRDENHLWSSDISNNIKFSEDHHVGILAGHIEYAAIENISVYYSSDSISAIDVDQSSANYLTDSGIIGLVYNLNPTVEGNSIGSETGSTIAGRVEGAGEEWGGSIDMLKMHTRLQSTLSVAKQNTPTYATAETVVIDEVNGTTTTTPTQTTNYQNADVGDAVIRTYQSELGGSFVFADDTNATSSARYNLFHGKSLTYFPKTVTTYTFKNQFENGFTISNGGNYLTVSNQNDNISVGVGNDSENATVWVLDDTNHLNCKVENGNTISVYYLNSDVNGNLTVSETASTTWTKDSDGTMVAKINGLDYYLSYNNGWYTYPFADSFTISTGNNYFGRNDSTTNLSGTATTAAKLKFENGKIYSFINGSVRYLNADGENLSFGDTATTANWVYDEGKFYCLDSNNMRWYLCFDNNEWKLFPEHSFHYIFSGNDYLSCTETGVVNSTAGNSVKWAWDKYNGRIYTVIDNEIYYLNGGTKLSVSKTAETEWMYINNKFCYSNNGDTWYLVDDNGSWGVYPSDTVYLISQNGKYLTIQNNGSVSAVNDSDVALRFMYDNTNGALYTVYNGDIYYINADNYSISASTALNTSWNKTADNSFNYNNNGETFTLIYNNGWVAYPQNNFATIHCDTDYLAASSDNLSNSQTPFYWIQDNDGKLSTIYNNTRYYLRATATGISLTNNSQQATAFSINSANKTISYSYNNNTYYLVFDEDRWGVSETARKGFKISVTGGNTTYYLNADTNKVSTGTNETAATSWKYNGSSGTISTVINDTTYYLQAAYETNNKVNSTNLKVTTNQSNATTFTYSNNNLSCLIGNTTHYLTLSDEGILKMANTQVTYYTIHNGASNYLSLSGTDIENSDADNAVLWQFSNMTTGTGSSANTTVSTLYNGNTNYLYYSSSWFSSSFEMSTQSQNWRWTGSNTLRNGSSTSYYLRYSGDEWTVNRTGSTLTRTAVKYVPKTVNLIESNYETESEETSVDNITDISETVANESETEITSSFEYIKTDLSESTIHDFDEKNRQVVEKTVETKAGGNDTYFPLDADTTAPFNVTDKNTGYIVGGSHASYQSEWGDVRVAYYNMSDLSNSLYGVNSYSNNSERLEVLTRTYLSNGFKRVSDTYNSDNTNANTSSSLRNISKVSVSDLGLKKYDNARSQLHDVFEEQPTRIYGMHFMDAVISTDNLIVAPKVKINGTEYTNYQMPEDSIDFRLKTKGYINFFAGTYYTNSGYENNSFFSLNQIFRNSNNEITEIKRIEKIYGDPSSEKKSYIYKYEGDNTPTLPNGYVLMFDTDWIERPDNMIYKSMYYFEVPVNSGEYALGSVNEKGRYGAYLCYLDIGASAADHSSVLGTIDFVYDNLSDKIVTVTDVSDQDTSLNYYVPSLAIMYSKNTDETNTVAIDNFKVNVRRTISSVNDSTATMNVTYSGSDAEHITTIKQTNNLGDTINQQTQ